jgi:hypothetical protein
MTAEGLPESPSATAPRPATKALISKRPLTTNDAPPLCASVFPPSTGGSQIQVMRRRGRKVNAVGRTTCSTLVVVGANASTVK